jgi:hypothetical protein
MELTPADQRFLEANHSAAMITVGSDGMAKAARVGVVVLDGRIMSSGTQGRARTRRLRDHPRCTLYVHDKSFGYLTLETTVTILEGLDVPALSLRMFRQMQRQPSGPLSWFGRQLDDDAFLQTMVDEGRVIYEFAVDRAYGMHSS